MSKFYTGQKIVAITDHSQGLFKKGDEFTVLNTIKSCCSNDIDVGIIRYPHQQTCIYCNKTQLKIRDSVYFDESCFAPIELSTTTFEDIIKQYQPCLN